MQAKTEKHFNVLFESDPEMLDLYFDYFKRKGLMDYADDILPRPTKEMGLRLTNRKENNGLFVSRITTNNVFHLLDLLS